MVVAETETQAREKLAEIKSLADPADALVLLSEVFNYDFAAHHLDEPLSDATLASISGLRGFLDRVIQQSGKQNPTVADFIKFSGRGTLDELPTFVGSPGQVADQLETWFTGGACDGFVLAATHLPGAYQDFVDLVAPELQSRGLAQEEYAGGTLRERLGIEPL